MEKKKTYINRTKEWLKETWNSFCRWWFYNSDILGVLAIFIGGASILIFTFWGIMYYYECNYDYHIKVNGTSYWVNEDEIKFENGIITFKNDGNEVRLSTYELQDNRKLR